MLIEVHIIQNHAPSNLNRDDSGSPKSAIFGGYRRARISSQCLKRCYRTSKTFRAEVDGLGMHTCSMPDEVIRRVLSKDVKLNDDEQTKLKAALVKVIKKGDGGVAGGESTSENGGAENQEVEKAGAQKDKLKTAQSVFWREAELNALAEGVRQWAANGKNGDFDAKAALKTKGLNWEDIPVDMALFGRMVTSDLMHNVEASSQFAHAISTHEWAREFDMWTRVDDRRDKRLDFYRDAFGAEEKLESGTDGMGDAEFTSACYYSYFNVDFDALIDNLTGKALKHDLDDSQDRPAAKVRACKAVVGLVKAAILERPTGKFNSMATPSLPTLVLVEMRDNHVPVSYADAFAKPVDPKNEEKQMDNGQIERVDLPKESARRLIVEANRITKAFTRTAMKRLRFAGGLDLLKVLLEMASGDPDDVNKDVTSIDDLLSELRNTLGCPKEKTNA